MKLQNCELVGRGIAYNHLSTAGIWEKPSMHAIRARRLKSDKCIVFSLFPQGVSLAEEILWLLFFFQRHFVQLTRVSELFELLPCCFI